MSGNVPAIDDMPFLKAKLGKARTDRIRYVNQADPFPQKAATNIHNTVLEDLRYFIPHRPGCRITDILSGVAHTTDTNKPLSVDRLFNIFGCMETINTREVMKMMDLDKRQAQRYVRATKVALPILEDYL